MSATTLTNPATLDVGMDLDGVNFRFDRAYIKGCVELGMLDGWPVGFRPWRWDFFLDLGHTASQFVANCHLLADAGLLWDMPLCRGARTMWTELASRGHRIHVITDRRFGSTPAVSEDATEAVLRALALPYTTLTFAGDKTIVPTDVMLEDKLENYDALAATRCQPVLLNRPWNHVPGDLRRRVSRHAEFVSYVHALAVTRTVEHVNAQAAARPAPAPPVDPWEVPAPAGPAPVAVS